jgi:DNA polymerase III epsilon subunit-like protein
MARRLVPQLSRRSLDHLSRFYGVENTARHRAGGDAVATAKVFLRLLKEARDRGCVTWQDLETLLAFRRGAVAVGGAQCHITSTGIPPRDALATTHGMTTMLAPLVDTLNVGRVRVHTIQAGGQKLDGGAMFGVVPKPLWSVGFLPTSAIASSWACGAC